MMNPSKTLLISLLIGAALAAPAVCQTPQQQTPRMSPQLPPGHHALLERLTGQLDLTWDQQLKIEPLLHAEESVTKPLLKYTALSAEEQQGIMNTIKLAARRQFRPLLTPEQQAKLDQDMDKVSKGSKKGGKGAAKKSDAKADVFADEESLSGAITAYSALSAEEKRTMLRQVKTSALHAGAELAPDQQKKLDAEIRELSSSQKPL
jgi:Spy/CpxP family protein refolding chaperone